MFEAAASILREFGDLRINKGEVESFIEVSPNVHVPRTSFDFDPLIEHFTNRAQFVPYNYIHPYVWGQRLGRRVYPIGNLDRLCYNKKLLVDDLGCIYEFGDGSFHTGDSIEEALETLIIGPKGWAPGRPWRREVEMGDWTFDIWTEKAEAEKQRRDKLRNTT